MIPETSEEAIPDFFRMGISGDYRNGGYRNFRKVNTGIVPIGCEICRILLKLNSLKRERTILTKVTIEVLVVKKVRGFE